jgi:hypothetical protein
MQAEPQEDGEDDHGDRHPEQGGSQLTGTQLLGHDFPPSFL